MRNFRCLPEVAAPTIILQSVPFQIQPLLVVVEVPHAAQSPLHPVADVD